jgi:hypothetical protein
MPPAHPRAGRIPDAVDRTLTGERLVDSTRPALRTYEFMDAGIEAM